MKKLIFKKFSKDLGKFFLLSSLSVTLIVWVIQAVNFLDLVTEDGHGFSIYFQYTLLSLPKIFSKILPFIYFASLFFIILKYENSNELIIFWTIGIKKIQFVNILIKFSIFYLILQIIFTTIIVPASLDKARSFIRSSNVDFFASIIKEKKFIDTVKNLTMFIEEKDKNGNLKNIFLKEKFGEDNSQIIYAQTGKVINKNNTNVLTLYDGKILNNENQKTTIIKFSKTELNLSRFSTKTTTTPKMQEMSTNELIACIFLLKNLSNSFFAKKFDKLSSNQNCQENKFKENIQEISKRIVVPLYIPILSLIASLVIIRSKDDYNFLKYKFLLFLFGVFVIIISEISIKYSSVSTFQNLLITLIPILLFIIIYIYFIKKFKMPNLANQ